MARDRRLPPRSVRSCRQDTPATLAEYAGGLHFDKVHPLLLARRRPQVLPQRRRPVRDSRERFRTEQLCAKDHKAQRELRSAAAIACAIRRNTCVVERRKKRRRSFVAWTQKLWKETDCRGETSSDTTGQPLSECLRPFPPASPRASPEGCSQKPGAATSSHEVWFAKRQSRRVRSFHSPR